MRYALGTVLSLPLSLMLIGLLAAALPMPWQEWLVLQLIAAVLRTPPPPVDATHFDS